MKKSVDRHPEDIRPGDYVFCNCEEVIMFRMKGGQY